MGKSLTGTELGKGIRQRKDGIYEARITAYGKTESIYSSNLAELKKTVKRGRPKTIYTVEEWFNIWFETYKAPKLRQTSIGTTKRTVSNTYLPIIGNLKLIDVNVFVLQKAINKLIEDGHFSKKVISEGLNNLKDCFAVAKSNNYIPTDPAFGVDMPYYEDTRAKKDRRFLETEEITEFLNEAKNHWLYEMTYLMIFTGLRVGEIGGLMWKDIDFKKKSMTLHQGLVYDYDGGHKTVKLSTLKTRNSYRTIPLTDGVIDVLIAQKEKTKYLRNDIEDQYKDLVFVTMRGTPVSRYAAERAIEKIVESINHTRIHNAVKNGCQYEEFSRVYPHALRHTFASLCYSSGMDAKVTQSIMGHANISTTLDIYTHLSKQNKEDSMNLFANYINEKSIG